MRLSTMCALPTDQDLEAASSYAGYPLDAGEFLLRLEASSPRGWAKFLEESG